jgi:GTP-binding protein HflX
VPQPLERTDLSVQHERAVLVGVILPESRIDARNPLGELKLLAESAGAVVVDGLMQRLIQPHNSTYIGSGKLEELHQRAEANEADLIIFDNDLSPRQIRNIEKVVGRKVLDRSELILDIFAARARTHEARLQVELAQLEYTAPRIRGMWTHLERIAGAGGATGAGAVGGIGTRGPGEKQIEIDRRIVKDRVAALKREMEKIDARKIREVESRDTEFTVSLVGYTNSGKSTLMNTLTGAGVMVKDRLFATLDTTTRRWKLSEGQVVLLSDTVGFVRDLPHRLVASFKATLEEAINADLLLHVVDASSPTLMMQLDSVNSVLEELGCLDRPTMVLLNKMDIAPDDVWPMVATKLPDAIPISARTGEGLDQLAEQVERSVRSKSVLTTLHVAAANGKLISELLRMAEVFERRYVGDIVEVDCRIDRHQLDQLCSRFPELRLPEELISRDVD